MSDGPPDPPAGEPVPGSAAAEAMRALDSFTRERLIAKALADGTVFDLRPHLSGKARR